MYPIEQVEALNPEVTRMVVRAPRSRRRSSRVSSSCCASTSRASASR
ncbi:MAG: hypothetical protein ACLTMP_03670 [Eggerthella lenta]